MSRVKVSVGVFGLCVVLFGGDVQGETPRGSTGIASTGRWKNYTDMKNVVAVATSGDTVWAATRGGLFLFRESSNLIAQFTNSEGLSSNNLTAVTVDRSGRVWVGSSEGFMNAFMPQSGEMKEVRDIKESSRVQKGIRGFFIRNDSLLIATDFGISVFFMSRFQFGDTYANFGFTAQPRVNSVIMHGNRIWAATDSGVVTASLSSTNLSAPSSWTIYKGVHGLPSQAASSVAAFRDTIVVGTISGMAYFTGNAFQSVSSLSGKSISAVASSGNQLFVLVSEASSFSLSTLSSAPSSPTSTVTNTEGTAIALALQANSSTPWIGTSFRGVARRAGNAWSYTFPNGPQSNLFTSVAVDSRGVVWAASGISGRGAGFYRYDPSAPQGSQWRNYTVSQHPLMKSNDYYKVSVTPNGSVWVSSWGYGVVEVRGDSIIRNLDQNSTPRLAGSVTTDPNFVVIGGVAADPQDSIWIVNRTANNGNYLARLTGSTTATYFTNGIHPGVGIFTNVVIDRNGTKWLADSEPTNRPAIGLYFLNENKVVSGTASTNGWGWMTITDGIPDRLSNIILSMAIDLEGRVCVGTGSGMMIITDPRNPKVGRLNSFPLQGQFVQAIAVDALNNKWVGTKEGIIVVSPDGLRLVASYSVLTTNGKLMDNDVRSLAIDQKRGIVYIGTEKGLSSLEIAPVQALRSFISLEFGPNPYFVPNEQLLTIQNLVAESKIKILSVDGALVTEFKAQGAGRAFWDGRDQSGTLVSSGIYFVVAFAENGNQVTTGKVAVIRR